MMMGRALLMVGAIATLGLLATAILALVQDAAAGQAFTAHIFLALVSSLLLLFSHCWIMFYFIGTGKAIKEAVAENDLEPRLVAETRRFKNRSYPWMMLAMGLAMTLFIVGGGVYTEAVPKWIHHALFWLTLVVQLRTLWIEQQMVAANDRLMAEINQLLAA